MVTKLTRAQLHNAIVAYIAHTFFNSRSADISEDMSLDGRIGFDNRAKIKLADKLKKMGVISSTISSEQITACNTVGDLISLAYSEEQ